MAAYIIEAKASRYEDYRAQSGHKYTSRAEAAGVLKTIRDRYPFSRIRRVNSSDRA